MAVNEREIVLDMLLEVEKGTYSHIVSNNALAKYGYLDRQVRRFFKRTFEGTLEYRDLIDWVINYYSKTPVRKMKPVVRNILRLSVYQIMFMEVPAHAICNEAVKLTSKRGFSGLKGFVNGVLRAILRSKDNLPMPDRNAGEKEYLSVKYSMPMWIVERWLSAYGSETCEHMLIESLKQKLLTVRINPKTMSSAEFETLAKERGIKVTVSPFYRYSFYTEGFDYIEDIPGYEEGSIYIQDISSTLACLASGAGEGDKCVDVCAAPGGKSMFLAELVGDKGLVVARDLSSSKTDLIRENIQRMGFDNIKAETFDATKKDEALTGKMDLVFADLPCSGLGVIGRKSDIKYRMEPDMTASLAKLQKNILDTVSSYVRPGGTLLFSTCTINREENEDNVDTFLRDHPEFHLVPLFEGLEDEFSDKNIFRRLCEEGKKGFIQILPGIYGMDGFFISKFRKD